MFSFEYSVHMNLNIVKLLLYLPLSSLTMSSTTRWQNSLNSIKAIDATVFLVHTALLYDRNSFAPAGIWSSEKLSLKGCKITGTSSFRVHTKHDQTLFDCLFSSSQVFF